MIGSFRSREFRARNGLQSAASRPFCALLSGDSVAQRTQKQKVNLLGLLKIDQTRKTKRLKGRAWATEENMVSQLNSALLCLWRAIRQASADGTQPKPVRLEVLFRTDLPFSEWERQHSPTSLQCIALVEAVIANVQRCLCCHPNPDTMPQTLPSPNSQGSLEIIIADLKLPHPCWHSMMFGISKTQILPVALQTRINEPW